MRFQENGELVSVPEPLACVAPIAYGGRGALEEDIARLKRTLGDTPEAIGFMTAASPGVVELFFENKFYSSHADYVGALGQALRNEYEAITGAGFLLQIDCPDLAAGWHVTKGRRWSKESFLQLVRENITAINDATVNIAPERMRLHLCWGNYEGPHDLDFPLIDLVEEVSRSRPATISAEGANPRHAVEIEAWRRLAENGKTVALGVIDTATTFVEHPDLVGRRALMAAEAIGPERLILSADCGFGTWAGLLPAIPEVIAWRKLQSLSAGAKLAREALTGVPA
jgi:5-methyltetrahydropteroyltriglutamate--homocysteine methyltransferase